MLKIGLVGAGAITAHHLTALSQHEDIGIDAACDPNPEALASFKKSISTFSSHTEMLANKKLDAVIVATPTRTHASIAEDVLTAGVPLLLEKPGALSRDAFMRLRDLSDVKNLPVFTLFHASYGSELPAAITELRKLPEQSSELNWKSVYSDPYGEGHPSRTTLVNSWVDSGINALSVVQKVLSPSRIELVRVHYAPSGEHWGTENSLIQFRCSGDVPADVTIECRWDRNLSSKSSKISNQTGHVLDLLHTEETLVVEYDENSETSDFRNGNPRLTNHYIRAFADAYAHISENRSNWDFSQACHMPYFEAFAGAP